MKLLFNAEKLKPLEENHLNISRCKSDINIANLYLTKDGKPWYVVSGEFQYSRYDYRMWEEEILKIKAGGCNVIATYAFWNHHEYKKNKWNFEKDMNVKLFLQLCQKHGMFVIFRMGPYCHGEVVLGGFPKYIFFNVKKRSNAKGYLAHVKKLYDKYYEQVGDCLYPKGAVIGVQIENEFTGKYAHMYRLKELAIESGFNVPIYTATAWSGELSEKEFLPLSGTYPDAPWEQSLKPIKLENKYKITPQYIDDTVGNDTIKSNDNVKKVFTKTPLGLCELGAGVQVTSHRRPYISTYDAYSLAFIQMAKGINILGYYIYHGGRNPNFAPMQESRKTLFPNNLPIMSYDFQAPIGEYGYPKEKYYYIRLLHYFALHFDENFPTKQVVFSKGNDNTDDFTTTVRIDESGSGYHFINTYQRHFDGNGSPDFSCEIKTQTGVITLPNIKIADKQSFFYPFNMTIGGVKFAYFTAQPLLKYTANDGEHYVFIKNDSVDVAYKTDKTLGEMGSEGSIKKPIEKAIVISDGEKNHIIDIYDIKTAATLYFDGKKITFSKDFIFSDDKEESILSESKTTTDGIKLVKIVNKKMPNDRYFYRKNMTALYELTIDKKILSGCEDIKIEFLSGCDMAHIYAGDLIVGDYINIDNNFEIYLSRYKEYIAGGKPLYIKVNARASKQFTYYEYETKTDDVSLSVKSATKITKIKRKK